MTDRRLVAIAADQPYPLLLMTVSGAHLYGFPSPDSDHDLRGSHILPVREVVGLDAGRETVEVSEVRDGLQVDLVTHDVKLTVFRIRQAACRPPSPSPSEGARCDGTEYAP